MLGGVAAALAAILIAALLVGGMFVVVTMLRLREARRVGGAQTTALTATFALAQAGRSGLCQSVVWLDLWATTCFGLGRAGAGG